MVISSWAARGLLVVTWLASSAPVLAARPASKEEPETLLRQGIELRRRGDDQRAHGYFKRAYEISRTPRTAAQLGLSDQAVGQFFEAEPLLSEALSSVDDPWVQEHKAILENSRKTVRQHLGMLTIVGAPDGTLVQIGEHAAIPVPQDGAIWVAPGESNLRFEAPERRAVTKTVTVAAGDKARVEIELVANAPPPRVESPPTEASPPEGQPLVTQPPEAAGASPSHRGRGARIAGLTLAGLGVAADVAGYILWSTAGAKLSAIETAAMTSGMFKDGDGNWRTYDRIGVGMLAGGSAAIIVGSIIYFANRHPSSAGAETRVSLGASPTVWPTFGPGSLGLMGRF
jgi:hypothetical protein